MMKTRGQENGPSLSRNRGRISSQCGFHPTGVSQRNLAIIFPHGRDSGRESVRSCKPRNTGIKGR